MSTSNKSRFVASIPFYIVDHMAWDLLVPVRCGNALSQVLESIVVEELLEFKVFRILPFPISLSFIDHYSFLMIARDLETILVAWTIPEVLESSLVDHPSDNFLALGVCPASSPAL